MKILSKEEFATELNKIVTYGASDIEIGIEDMKIAMRGDIYVTECLDLDSDDNSIVLDIEDINQITKNQDLLVMSTSEYSGDNSAEKAIKSAILDFEKNNLSLKEADGILIYFQINSDYKIVEIAEAIDIVNIKCENDIILEEPDIIWGISCDNDLKNDYVKATVFIGFSKKREIWE